MTSKSLPQPRFQHFKTLRALAFGLAIGFAAPAFADNLPDIQRLIKQGQYPQALNKVDAYLSDKPKDAQGRFLKGLIYTEMNKPADAIAIFTKLTEDFPELPEPYNNLAVIYAQQKQFDKARSALEMAIRTHPSYAIAYENLGDVYAKLASQSYDKALQLDNGNIAMQNKLAAIRDLITSSSKSNTKPNLVATATPAVTTTVASKPAAAPVTATNTNVISTTQGVASTSSAKVAEPKATPTTAAVAVTPPATKPAPAKADNAKEEIAKSISAWASAWALKDMTSYLGAYANDFTPPNNMTRQAWEKAQQSRMTKKSDKTSMTYDEPQISIVGDQATATIQMRANGARPNSSTTKTLLFVRTGNKWLIKEENSR